MAVPSVYVPKMSHSSSPTLLHLQEAPLRWDLIGLAQSSYKITAFALVLEHERLCAHHLVKSLFSTVLWGPPN